MMPVMIPAAFTASPSCTLKLQGHLPPPVHLLAARASLELLSSFSHAADHCSRQIKLQHVTYLGTHMLGRRHLLQHVCKETVWGNA
jgi:hypothetical protein